MNAIEFVESYYYNTVFFFFFLVLSWSTVLYHVGSNSQKILHAEKSPMQIVALLLTLMVTFYLGLRPVSDAFVDMRLYAYSYRGGSLIFRPINLHTEWLWSNIMVACRRMSFNVNEFFLVVEIGYVGSMFAFAWKHTRGNLWLMMLFFFMAFQFYTFGTNGIRNGLACSVSLLAIAFLINADESKFSRNLAFILFILSMGVHRSATLPAVAALGSWFYMKDTKWPLRFWLLSIGISLAAGPLVEQFFVSLGFDDRMEEYSSANMSEKTASVFSGTGFRWDFLMYSAAPVLMIWYVTRYRRFTDKGYSLIANTYLLCNAFWIMVIRAAFSNRFAYLSWFIYPVVIAYPLLRMNLWKDQDRRTALTFFLYSGFSFFMFFIYYYGTSGFKGFDLYWWRK